MSTQKQKPKRKDDSIFEEIDSELPEDLSDLMVDGKRPGNHSRGWSDDDGR